MAKTFARFLESRLLMESDFFFGVMLGVVSPAEYGRLMAATDLLLEHGYDRAAEYVRLALASETGRSEKTSAFNKAIKEWQGKVRSLKTGLVLIVGTVFFDVACYQGDVEFELFISYDRQGLTCLTYRDRKIIANGPKELSFLTAEQQEMIGVLFVIAAARHLSNQV